MRASKPIVITESVFRTEQRMLDRNRVLFTLRTVCSLAIMRAKQEGF